MINEVFYTLQWTCIEHKSSTTNATAADHTFVLSHFSLVRSFTFVMVLNWFFCKLTFLMFTRAAGGDYWCMLLLYTKVNCDNNTSLLLSIDICLLTLLTSLVRLFFRCWFNVVYVLWICENWDLNISFAACVWASHCSRRCTFFRCFLVWRRFFSTVSTMPASPEVPGPFGSQVPYRQWCEFMALCGSDSRYIMSILRHDRTVKYTDC